jgi:phenylalanyl-tRNA synthetase alpha chain
LIAVSDLITLEQEILAQIAATGDEAALEAVRVAALGKKGSISALLATLGKMSPDERKTQGAAINLAKDKVTSALSARRDVLKSAALDARLASKPSTSRFPYVKRRLRPAASIR